MHKGVPRRRSVGDKKKTQSRKRRHTPTLIFEILDSEPKKLFSTEKLLVMMHDMGHLVPRREFGVIMTRAFQDGLIYSARMETRQIFGYGWQRWRDRPDYKTAATVALVALHNRHPWAYNGMDLQHAIGDKLERNGPSREVSFMWVVEQLKKDRLISHQFDRNGQSGYMLTCMTWLNMEIEQPTQVHRGKHYFWL